MSTIAPHIRRCGNEIWMDCKQIKNQRVVKKRKKIGVVIGDHIQANMGNEIIKCCKITSSIL